MLKFYYNSLRRKYIYLMCAAVFGALLFYVSTLPFSKIEESIYPQISDLFDMMNHFFGFCIFNFLLFSTFLAFHPKAHRQNGFFFSPAYVYIVYVAIGVLWGAACEGMQYILPTRSFQYIDIIANTAPVPVVSLLLKKWIKKYTVSR
jgi:VanZ family protein